MDDTDSKSEQEQELIDWAKNYASSQGWTVNPDPGKLDVVIRGLLRNKDRFGERYCPCRIRSGDYEKDREIICPCVFHRDEIRDDGQCHCNLFFRQ